VLGNGWFISKERYQSTVASTSAGTTENKQEQQQQPYKPRIRDVLDLTFNDARQAYRSKSTGEILRAWIVFKLCGINFLVENNDKLMKLGQKVMGKKLFEKVMESTFYGHFVAGPDEVAIQPRLQHLREHGVKAILDYSVEEDIGEDAEQPKPQSSASSVETPAADPEYAKYQADTMNRTMKAGARTYFYMNEAQCEKNMETFLHSIEAVSNAATGKTFSGFAAIKITALGRPELLLKVSEAIARVHRYVGAFSGKMGKVAEQNVKVEDIKRRLDRAADSDPTVKAWLDNMTYDKSGIIHILPWRRVVEADKSLKEALKVADVSTGKMKQLVPALSEHEEEMFQNMMRRLHTVFKMAKRLDVRVMVDAEQSYFQPAISRLAIEMARIYNTEKAIVFNTYQCYLKEAHNNLVHDLDQAERQNFFFGAKLVRGAYMEQERHRAEEMGYEDPINPNFEATTEMYHKCVLEVMTRMKRLKDEGKPKLVGIMMATHNEDTVRFVIQKMKELTIKRSDKLVCFGQLYGMCDQVSFPLGQSGYSVYKYVPYGPVTEVLPYLSRRAQENKGFLTKIKKETTLLRKEFFRRLMKGQLFYRPKGHYEPL